MSELSFEEAITRLEEIVTLLESGDCTLENSIKLYDEGLKLSASCRKKLNKAKQKVVDIEEYIKGVDENE